MPIYEYKCSNGPEFERRQSYSDEAVAECPQCSRKAHRVMHAVPVIFKGSGFYVNDYARSGPPVNGNVNKETTTKDTKPAETTATSTKTPEKSEKPAARTESKATAAQPGK